MMVYTLPAPQEQQPRGSQLLLDEADLLLSFPPPPHSAHLSTPVQHPWTTEQYACYTTAPAGGIYDYSALYPSPLHSPTSPLLNRSSSHSEELTRANPFPSLDRDHPPTFLWDPSLPLPVLEQQPMSSSAAGSDLEDYADSCRTTTTAPSITTAGSESHRRGSSHGSRSSASTAGQYMDEGIVMHGGGGGAKRGRGGIIAEGAMVVDGEEQEVRQQQELQQQQQDDEWMYLDRQQKRYRPSTSTTLQTPRTPPSASASPYVLPRRPHTDPPAPRYYHPHHHTLPQTSPVARSMSFSAARELSYGAAPSASTSRAIPRSLSYDGVLPPTRYASPRPSYPTQPVVLKTFTLPASPNPNNSGAFPSNPAANYATPQQPFSPVSPPQHHYVAQPQAAPAPTPAGFYPPPSAPATRRTSSTVAYQRYAESTAARATTPPPPSHAPVPVVVATLPNPVAASKPNAVVVLPAPVASSSSSIAVAPVALTPQPVIPPRRVSMPFQRPITKPHRRRTTPPAGLPPPEVVAAGLAAGPPPPIPASVFANGDIPLPVLPGRRPSVAPGMGGREGSPSTPMVLAGSPPLSGGEMGVGGGAGPVEGIHPRFNGSPAPVSKDAEKQHECSFRGCAKMFRRLEHLKRHERSHTQERPYGCDVCGKWFSRSDNLAQHRKTHAKRGEQSPEPGLEYS